MSLEDILRKDFSKGIRNLILCSYWEDLDTPIPYVFVKVMVTYVDVLGMRAKLRKPGEFLCARVVFKILAVYVGLGTDNLKTLLANFLNQEHDRKFSCSYSDMVMYLFILSSGLSNLYLQLGRTNDWTSCI